MYFDLGAGLDFPVTSQLYIRGQGLVGFDLTPTVKTAKDGLTDYKDFGYKIAANIGVGYKF